MDRTSDYDFDLPEGRIAQVPCDAREDSRLLVLPGSPSTEIVDAVFSNIADFLPPQSVIVVNDTRVIRARVRARKPTGGAIELLFVAPVQDSDTRWRCLANSSKPARAGQTLTIVDTGGNDTGEMAAVVARHEDGSVEIETASETLSWLAEVGELPLPPYIERSAGPTRSDHDRYQTVFAETAGAVAAPTAGLHFSRALVDDLAGSGHSFARITLHVGPGTFRPVRAEAIADHKLDVERYDISADAAAAINSGRPVVAVGTTSVRTLEAAATADGTVAPGAGATELFIRPGYRFRVVDHLVTNFHLPRSTLLMLVAAFAGFDRTMAAYRHAIAGDYRFYSYGDAMLLSAAGAS